MVSEIYSPHSKLICCVTDVDGECYFIARNCTMNGHKIGLLSIGKVIIFDRPSKLGQKPFIVRKIEPSLSALLVRLI